MIPLSRTRSGLLCATAPGLLLAAFAPATLATSPDGGLWPAPAAALADDDDDDRDDWDDRDDDDRDDDDD